jgi:hypothetical protein
MHPLETCHLTVLCCCCCSWFNIIAGAGDDSAMKPWLSKLASNLKREHTVDA